MAFDDNGRIDVQLDNGNEDNEGSTDIALKCAVLMEKGLAWLVRERMEKELDKVTTETLGLRNARAP